MRTNLIYDDLEVRDWQRVEFTSNVIDVSTVINMYPQLSESQLHDIELLEVLSRDTNSIIYKFDGNVLKYIIDEYKIYTEEFYREIIIGLEINKLESNNFVRTIGYYISDKCDVPYAKNKKCIYLYVKEIHGPTLTNFIPTASLVQFKDIMLKLLRGYKIAHDKLDFCHYDFHSNNVIISNKDDELIPVIIDFGASHIKLPQGNIGELWPEEGRYDGIALWVYDIFKIFAFSYRYSSYSYIFGEINNEFMESSELYTYYIENMHEYTTPTYAYGVGPLDEEIEETPEEFLNRLEKSDVKFNDKNLSVKFIRNIIPKATKLKKRNLRVLKENSQNLSQINKYCRKVLKYFHKDIWPTSFLDTYDKQVSPTWGVSVTKEGVKSSLKDFITYVENIK